MTEKHSLNETHGASVSTEAKKVKGGSREETKKTYLQGVWSEENEIAALQRRIGCSADMIISECTISILEIVVTPEVCTTRGSSSTKSNISG